MGLICSSRSMYFTLSWSIRTSGVSCRFANHYNCSPPEMAYAYAFEYILIKFSANPAEFGPNSLVSFTYTVYKERKLHQTCQKKCISLEIREFNIQSWAQLLHVSISSYAWPHPCMVYGRGRRHERRRRMEEN